MTVCLNLSEYTVSHEEFTTTCTVSILQAPIDAKIPKLKDLRLIECRDYYDLGLQLDLRPNSLEALKKETSGDTRDFARGIFSSWLKGQGNKPTFKNLVLALRRIKEIEEAKKLCDKFGE